MSDNIHRDLADAQRTIAAQTARIEELEARVAELTSGPPDVQQENLRAVQRLATLHADAIAVKEAEVATVRAERDAAVAATRTR